jgi:hypothetical protein
VDVCEKPWKVAFACEVAVLLDTEIKVMVLVVSGIAQLRDECTYTNARHICTNGIEYRDHVPT